MVTDTLVVWFGIDGIDPGMKGNDGMSTGSVLYLCNPPGFGSFV
jgi:hypothetical protein